MVRRDGCLKGGNIVEYGGSMTTGPSISRQLEG